MFSDIFILCEGNYGLANASLWSMGSDYAAISGPIYWDEGSSTDNPLGDVGQSMLMHDNFLYIVMNNSNTIEVMDISADTIIFNRSISLPNVSPRYISIANDIAYITSWNLPGIISMDIVTDEMLDTLLISDYRMRIAEF